MYALSVLLGLPELGPRIESNRGLRLVEASCRQALEVAASEWLTTGRSVYHVTTYNYLVLLLLVLFGHGSLCEYVTIWGKRRIPYCPLNLVPRIWLVHIPDLLVFYHIVRFKSTKVERDFSLGHELLRLWCRLSFSSAAMKPERW